MRTYKTKLFHNGRPLIVVVPVLLGSMGLFAALTFVTGQPIFAIIAFPVPVILLAVLRRRIWDYFSEPATVQIADDSFSIVLSGETLNYNFAKLSAFRTYQGTDSWQMMVYPADEKMRTFSFLETSDDPDINPVPGVERQIKKYNAGSLPQNRVQPALSLFASRSGAILLGAVGGVSVAGIVWASFYNIDALFPIILGGSVCFFIFLAKRSADQKRFKEASDSVR